MYTCVPFVHSAFQPPWPSEAYFVVCTAPTRGFGPLHRSSRSTAFQVRPLQPLEYAGKLAVYELRQTFIERGEFILNISNYF